MNQKIVLVIAGLLVFIGLTKPDLSKFINRNNNPVVVDEIIVVTPPADIKLREVCQPVIETLKGNPRDARRLSNTFLDIARLIELDGEEMVIKNTEEIKQANSLVGAMLRLDIKGKYPSLSKDCQAVVVSQIGDDNVTLTKELRSSAVEAFMGLGWACYEGSK